MKLGSAFSYSSSILLLLGGLSSTPDAVVSAQENNMVKMCLFYGSPSAHARSDPIINQQCASDHVHTFYGPQKVHPDTTYEELRDTPPQFSTSPFVENQSLYWHPAIYQVTPGSGGSDKTYTRAPNLESSPYYRWDNGTSEPTVAFPPGFRMIAHSNDPGANQGGENEFNLFTECCDLRNGDEECEFRNQLWFPTKRCDFLGIAFSMPTCWDGVHLGNEASGPGSDHKSHMAYTTNGKVNGPCPSGFPKRVPQVQLFIRVIDYQGGTYQLADGTTTGGVFHFDFMNGWKEGTLQNIIDNCPVADGPYEDDEYNPPCDCAEQFLTEANQAAEGQVCDADIRRLILDEPTQSMSDLPRGTCEGPTLKERTWARDEYPNFSVCDQTNVDNGGGGGGTPPPPTAPEPSPVAPPVEPPVEPPTDNGGGGINNGDCEEDEHLFELELMTDFYPQETSWELRNADTNEIVETGRGYGNSNENPDYKETETLFEESYCLESDQEYTFTIYDSYEDGLCCEHGEGYFVVRLNGEDLGDGDSFGSSETITFSTESFGIGAGENSPEEFCRDDDNWTWTTRRGKVVRTCDWVADRPSKRCSKVGDDDRSAREACSESCDECE